RLAAGFPAREECKDGRLEDWQNGYLRLVWPFFRSPNLPFFRRIMTQPLLFTLVAAAVLAASPHATAAGPLTVAVPAPAPPNAEGFNMGQSRRPDGATLTFDSQSFLLDGKRWTPVMGEFHYARYPETEWRDELLKMKAGGIDIVATYVFWIYHEEVEGEFDWSGRRDLRHFVQLCGDLGLKVMVRCGPWCHG